MPKYLKPDVTKEKEKKLRGLGICLLHQPFTYSALKIKEKIKGKEEKLGSAERRTAGKVL
jgi:hypothetical protein